VHVRPHASIASSNITHPNASENRFGSTTVLVSLPSVRLRFGCDARKGARLRQRVQSFSAVPRQPNRAPLCTSAPGETNAIAPLVKQLQAAYPEQQFLVTTMTPTGSAQVQALLGDQVAHCYAPYDFPWAVRSFYARVQPKLLVLMETELWPNLIDVAAKSELPVMLINARLSERSARGYGRISALTRPMLGQLSRVACQETEHEVRFRSLGANTAGLSTLGSIKFDKALPVEQEAKVFALTQQWQLAERWVWIAASTHPGEDEVVLSAHQQLLAIVPNALLLLVPRHPVRADDVVHLAEQAQLRVAKQTQAEELTSDTIGGLQVLVADTMGQLQQLYGLAQVAFVGGSLVPMGGHDPIEAALCRMPMVMGTHRFNFPLVCERFVAAGALESADDAVALVGMLRRWYQDEGLRREQGEAAAEVVSLNTGAQVRTFELLGDYLAALD
ncbi:UNVERIFIED_CONTAM: hypothetical protein GTU68_058065, partial [Idotea baltica]|nr:hypothetical protein [Idotea baltica]